MAPTVPIAGHLLLGAYLQVSLDLLIQLGQLSLSVLQTGARLVVTLLPPLKVGLLQVSVSHDQGPQTFPGKLLGRQQALSPKPLAWGLSHTHPVPRAAGSCCPASGLRGGRTQIRSASGCKPAEPNSRSWSRGLHPAVVPKGLPWGLAAAPLGALRPTAWKGTVLMDSR